MKNISERTVERLSVYRRVLLQLREADDAVVFSHQLSESAGVTAAQVRRDIMHLGCSGVPNSGYRMGELLNAINALHDAHHDDPTFGYRYLADEARRAGWRMSRRTAWKL